MAHRLAVHLQTVFGEHSVDCEYNRRGSDPKAVDISRKEFLRLIQQGRIPARLRTGFVAAGKRPVSIYPDVVVHARGHDANNVLALELKKADGSRLFDSWDRWKLAYYVGELAYTLGAFITLPNEPLPVDQWEIEWFPPSAI